MVRAAKEGSKAVESIGEEVERSKRTRIPFEQLTGLVRSLSLSLSLPPILFLSLSLSTLEDLQITRR